MVKEVLHIKGAILKMVVKMVFGMVVKMVMKLVVKVVMNVVLKADWGFCFKTDGQTNRQW